jgi:5-methylthioadenosine/S-adenosylhomocysteine deaminase
MDKDRRIIEDGVILVRDGRIASIGPAAELAGQWDGAEVIDCSGMVAIPGLINTHAHLATALFKGLAEDLSLKEWLEKSWKYENAFITPTSVALGSKLAMLELVEGGVTCAVDMYWHPEAAIASAKELGFRLASGPVFIEGGVAPDGLDISGRFSAAEAFAEKYRPDPLIIPMLMPHGTCTDSPELLRKVKRLADKLGLAVNLHCAETQAERDGFLARHGKSPVKALEDLGYMDGRSILAHCVHVDVEDINAIASGAVVAHNPMSNLKLGSGIAPVEQMRAAGAWVSLGTDGSMSGNDLDMWLAMRLAASLQKAKSSDASACPAAEVFAMATINGAEAIGMGKELGSLETGKRADVVLLDVRGWHSQPLYDPYAFLVYAAGREDVRTVLVEGRIVMRDRKIPGLDAPGFLEEIQRKAREIRQFQ